MSWEDRLRPQIKLTAPDNTEFIAKWSGNDVSKDKKLGIFDYPDTDGSGVQDLGVNSSRHPITFFFDGEDNDITAKQFYTACDQRGVWSIIHPVDGPLNLILASVTKKIQPISSGNITVFDTNWIEPIRDQIKLTDKQISAEIEDAISQAKITAAEQYANNLKINTQSEIIANKKTIFEQLIDAKEKFMALVQQGEQVYNNFNKTIRSIQDTAENIIGQAETVADQIQKIPFYISQIREDIGIKINAIGDYINDIVDRVNSIFGNTSEDKNTANVCEINAAASIEGMAQVVITEEIDTRTQAVEIIEQIQDNFDSIITALDAIQENYKTKSIDKQYFSNSLSFQTLSYLMALTIRFLIESSLSLKIEKRFTLKKSRSPIEITVSEYGTLGENDKNLDFFITTNMLKKDEIRLLSSGREVVVYV
jgi:prophage DNA circulation protein